MAHFAQLNSDNVVINVIKIDTMEIVDMELGDEVEELGISKLRSLYGDDTRWVKTSYSGSTRERFASVGYTYNESLDCFVTPKPFESWTFNNEIKDWEAPVPKPTDSHSWNEDSQEWELLG